MIADTHTCPYCELQFDFHDEVRDHVLRIHRDHLPVPGSGAVRRPYVLPAPSPPPDDDPIPPRRDVHDRARP